MSLAAYSLNDRSRDLRAELPHLAFLQEAQNTLRAVKALTRYCERARVSPQPAVATSSSSGRKLLAEILAKPGAATLDEPTSKRLLSAYGIASPREELARSAQEAATIAKRIGFPVVAKVVSEALPHKSDIGGVILNIASPDEAASAFGNIEAALAALPDKPKMDGVLIAEMAKGGLELVLGATRDPEMGPLILFGSGGVNIELYKDVALAASPLDEQRARELIARTRAGSLVSGYRGSKPLDIEALVSALIGLSNLMSDADGRIVSIDVNPFLLREKGGLALDGLIVRR
jgi:acetyltransferase